MNDDKMDINRIITYAGAFIALLIGSGFATGQETLQYFAAYGLWGLAGVAICFVLLAFIGIEFMTYGNKYKLEMPNDIYTIIAGEKIGRFYDYFSIFFIFLSFAVMIAGAHATAVQEYGFPSFLGGALIGLAVIVTVSMGLKKIVQVIGKIGPFIAVTAFIVSIISIRINWSNLGSAAYVLDQVSKSPDFKRASINFVFSAGSYVGFCMIWLAAFLADMGNMTKSLADARKGAFFGALATSIAMGFMAFAIYLSMGRVYNSQIPSLLLAGEIHPLLSKVFSVFIILGIFTTAVPLLWTVVSRFFEEKEKGFRRGTIAIGAVGTLIGLSINFDVLVNYVYVINGYIGIFLILIMIYRALKRLRA